VPGRVGVWTTGGGAAPAEKVAAIGVRLRRWVSSHGFAINVAPDLEHFSGVVPCGVRDAGVTSLAKLGIAVRMEEVDAALREVFERRFGATAMAGSPQAQAEPGLAKAAI
jgi:lipoyl(octanoyl) transferase